MEDLLGEKLRARWDKYGQGPAVEASGGDTRIVGEAGDRHTNGRSNGANDDAGGSDDDEKENLVYRELWSSGKKEDAKPTLPSTSFGAAIADLKERAKDALSDGDVAAAESLYTEGLAILAKHRGSRKHSRDELGNGSTGESSHENESEEEEEEEGHRNTAAILYSNRSYCRAQSQRWLESIADAYAAIELRPDWAKPYYRIAQAKAGLGDYRNAVAACRQGQRLLEDRGDRSREFVALMDEISNEAFLSGSLAGFDGRLLLVRSAGEEAWLGREAPANPLIDDVAEDGAVHLSQLGLGREWDGDGDGDGGAGGDEDHAGLDDGTLAALAARRKSEALAKTSMQSFRSLKEAVGEAKDGDRILLLRGIHNTGGATIFVDKRVLIRSEGTLEETTIDHRGNSPIFRITRNAVLQNVDIDMTGFRESLYVSGGPKVCPVIEHCRFRCSGDDAINVAGQAKPIFRKCHVVHSKKVGLRLFDRAGGEYIGLRISSCEQQAVKVMEGAQGAFYGCVFEESKEEGVVVMDSGEASLRDCCIRGNQGPGVDVSGRAKVSAVGCEIQANVGGVWLWDDAKAVLSQCK
uniref:Right handed beta helix domain-containing protein n=1 Tax=Chloropicon laureae TaxID=464258 RepID=A0A7S2Z3P6_9CHLO|mmetsp:Transcript_4476/g.11283  ORF Transcript_4476/g.11283 Transcript_4476/m.11283 type:complete len:579 (+) Transcript_4476:219-1955(+)